MAREPLRGAAAAVSVAPYALAVAVLVFAIASQYFVPQNWPASRTVYRSLAGDLAVVYGIPIVAFALLVGTRPLAGWKDDLEHATVVGLGWYGVLGVVALVVTIVLTAVFLLLDPAALHLLSKPNPDLEAAAGDPWLYVALSFAVGAFEETIFRGWVFGYWVARGVPWVTPAILSSALFASLHLYYGTTYGWASAIVFPTLFLLGFAFAATYRSARGNLVVPAALHGAYDASAYLTLISLGAGVGFRYGLIVLGAVVGVVYYLRRSERGGPPPAPYAGSSAGVAPPPRSSTGPPSPAPMGPSDEGLRGVPGYRFAPLPRPTSERRGDRSNRSSCPVPTAAAYR